MRPAPTTDKWRNVKNVLDNVLNVVTDKKLLEQINNLLNNL